MTGEPVARDAATVLAGPVLDVAPRLLGAVLTHRGPDATVAVRITEVEAYAQDDPAAHTFRGRTARNAPMFLPGGHLYVYRSHGIHLCANVVAGPRDDGAAVLVRGGRVVRGRDAAVGRRGGRDDDDWLAAGPGRLGQALGLEPGHSGAWLLGEGPLRLRLGDAPDEAVVRTGPRVGVSRAADRPWRFWLDGAPGVSRYRRSPRAPEPRTN